MRVPSKLLGLTRHAVERKRLPAGFFQSFTPHDDRRIGFARQLCQRLFCRHLFFLLRSRRSQRRHPRLQLCTLGDQCPGGVGQLSLKLQCPIGKHLSDRQFVGIDQKVGFLGRHLFQLVAVYGLGYRYARLFDAQPHHRDHVGHDDDDVLSHLSPGYRTHAPQKRADQNAPKPQKNAQLERDAQQA